MTTALIVEDEKVVATILRHVLEMFGLQVLQAFTLSEAMQIASAAQPHLILLDLALPDSDPENTISKAKELKETANAAHLHILTGFSGDTIKYRLAEGNQDSFAFKMEGGMTKEGLAEVVIQALKKMNTDDALKIMEVIAKI